MHEYDVINNNESVEQYAVYIISTATQSGHNEGSKACITLYVIRRLDVFSKRNLESDFWDQHLLTTSVSF